MSTKNQKLQSQLLKIIVAVYLLTTIASFALIYVTLNYKIEELGTTFSVQYLQKEKNKITNPIEREIALAKKMADTPLLQEWAENEDEPQLKEKAIAALESYRQHFQDKSYFFIVDESRNYYFNDQDGATVDGHYKYTLQENIEDDQWYFQTMDRVKDFVLNVNVDRVLNTTKVWIDVIVYNNQGEKLGMAGTGLTLDTFLDSFIHNSSSYITPVLFDQNGYIQAYEDPDYIELSSITTGNKEEGKKIFALFGDDEAQEIKDCMLELKENNQLVHTMEISFGGKKQIASMAFIPAINWHIMVLLDTSELFSIWDFTPTIGILLLSLLLISLAIMYFIRRLIMNPIDQLKAFTEDMSAGNYEKRIQLGGNNELGVLANSFNKMAATIHQHTNNLEELVAQRTRELTRSNKELAIKNNSIMDNISYARYLQLAIIPEQQALESYFREYFIFWQPKDSVGGDFYWFKERRDDFLIAVIDCTGHGVPGALMTMTANAVLNRIVDTEELKKPSQILKRFDEVLKETLRQDQGSFHRDDGLDVGLCAVDINAGKLTFAGAKMDLYYTENDQIVYIQGDRRSIGYQRGKQQVGFKDHEIRLEGKIFYMTTDGFLDQNCKEGNRRFSRKAFITLLEKNLHKNLDQQGQIIKEELKEFMGEEKQRDDITVIGFKLKTTG